MYFLQDALDSPLIENDYASVNDALPEGQLQRIKSTQRKVKDKNKLKTGIQCSLGLTPPRFIAKLVIPPNYRLHRRWRFNEEALYLDLQQA